MDDALRERALRVRAKLERLRDTQSHARADDFGVSAHRFALLPCATDAELAATEAAAGVPLPDAYRAYLQLVAGGGSGPYYGVLPLRAPADTLPRDCRVA